MKIKAAIIGAAIALFAFAGIASATEHTYVTVSWRLPVEPTFVGSSEGLGIVGSNYSGNIFSPPQTFALQDTGQRLGAADLLPQECGTYVQEDVYYQDTQAQKDKLTALEDNGLTKVNGSPADGSILVDRQWEFLYTGDCKVVTPPPGHKPSPTPSRTPHATPPATSTGPLVLPIIGNPDAGLIFLGVIGILSFALLAAYLLLPARRR